MKNDWSNDWSTFIDSISAQIRGGRTTESLNELYGGHNVRWAGTVVGVDLDELAPGIDLDMLEKVVDLGHGQTTNIDGLALPIADETRDDWSKIKPGDQVLFEATLGSGYPPFPPIELESLSTGRTILSIRLHRGKLIRHMQSKS